MAAATVESTKLYDLGPFFLSEVVCTTMTVDIGVTVPHGGPKGEAPIAVYLTSSSAAVGDNGVMLTRIPSGDSTTNGTVDFVPHTEDGAALTAGTKARVYCLFASRANQTGEALYTSFTV